MKQKYLLALSGMIVIGVVLVLVLTQVRSVLDRRLPPQHRWEDQKDLILHSFILM